MQSLSRLTLFLCCTWIITLLYGEMVAYWVPLWTCSWPQSHRSSSNADDQVKVAILADPQLMDRTSHGLAPRSFALEAAQFYTDLYMRRSFHASILPFKPDLVLFLGDHFDGGPFLSDQEWQESLSRFKHIFGLDEQGRNLDMLVYFLSGNHDIGYADFHSLYPKVIRRYEKEFGARNYRFTVGKVEFIAVDAQTLDGPSQGNQTRLSWDFIRNISMDVTLNPRVLLTHIPLYRADGTPCGAYRSSHIINQRVSRAGSDQRITYQNYLSKETSVRLLDFVRPILVLSGHDHDQCTVTHSTPLGSVTEHTLGTISWQQGNLHPSFMLLSTSSASSNATNLEHTVVTNLCFLPMQTHIYIWYLSQLFTTLLLLMFWPTNGLGCWACYGQCVRIIGAIGRKSRNIAVSSKEKDEDENCEYEMIWDAEGSMHLVKKASKNVQTTNSVVGSEGRSNAIVRPTAKKHIMQEEPEASVSVEMNADVKLDNTVKLPHRLSSKSKARKLIKRLIRVFGLLMPIVAVNATLYMMLLFKDWIGR